MEIFHLSKDEISKNINKKYGLLRESLLMELYNINKHSSVYELNLVEIGCDILYQDINGKTIFHLACDDNKFFEYLLFHIHEIPENIKTIFENNGNQKALKLLELHRLLNRCLDKNDENIKKILSDKEIDIDDFYQALKRKKDIFKAY